MKKIIYLVVASCLVLMNVSAKRVAKGRSVKKSAKTVRTVSATSAAPMIHLKMSDRVLSGKEKMAVDAYMIAFESYNEKKYKTALSKLTYADNLLGKPTARTSYLEAKICYEQGDYVAARTACAAYFAASPRHDSGYDEMTSISSSLNAYFAQKATQMQAEAKQRQAEQEAAEQAQKEAAQKQQAAIQAAAVRRQQAAAEDAAKLKAQQDAFAAARAANTKDAYMQFIYAYPYGKFRPDAEKEMAVKWPSPKRQLKKNLYGYVDAKGKFVVKAKYDYASEFVEDRGRVGRDGKYGFVDADGKEVIPLVYKSAANFSYGLSAVKDDAGNAYFLQKDGSRLGDKSYKDAKPFSESLAAVADDYFKYGYISTDGTVVIPNAFDVAGSFHEGFAAVGKSENGSVKYGYINANGEQLTDFIYEDARDFQMGAARVKVGDKYGLIDRFGNPITCCDYDYITDFRSDGYARARRANIDVLLDTDGTPWTNVNGYMIQVKFKTN